MAGIEASLTFLVAEPSSIRPRISAVREYHYVPISQSSFKSRHVVGNCRKCLSQAPPSRKSSASLAKTVGKSVQQTRTVLIATPTIVTTVGKRLSPTNEERSIEMACHTRRSTSKSRNDLRKSSLLRAIPTPNVDFTKKTARRHGLGSVAG
jgi:hypothetical protein